jgi:hypothetical protein
MHTELFNLVDLRRRKRWSYSPTRSALRNRRSTKPSRPDPRSLSDVLHQDGGQIDSYSEMAGEL